MREHKIDRPWAAIRQPLSSRVCLAATVLVLALPACGGGGGGGSGTVAPGDVTPPTVISTTPSDAAQGVAVDTTPSATFSEEMDPATVAAAFIVKDGGGNTVAGTVSYSGTTATFSPLAAFAYAASYSARITVDARDVAGNALASERVWSFATAARTPAPSGLGAVPEVVAGERQVSLSWVMEPAVSYNLYWGTAPGVTKLNGNRIVIGPLVPNYVHSGLTGGTPYYYVLTATRSGEGESDESAEVSATPPFSTAITRYAPDGSLSWQRGVNASNVAGAALATLADGSAYVAGNFSCTVTFGAGESGETTLTQPSCSSGPDGPIEMFLARYRADGTLAWARQTQDSLVRQPKALTVLSDGSLIVVGSYLTRMTLGPGDPNETTLACAGVAACVFIARYGDDGALRWARHAAGGDPALGSEARGVVALSDDSFVLTGSFFKDVTFNPGDPDAVTLNTTAACQTNDFDVFVTRYHEDGAVAWAKRAGGCDWEEGLSVAALPGDVPVITGRFRGSATFGPGEAGETILVSDVVQRQSYDVFVAAYESISGGLAWAKPAHSPDVDDLGNGASRIGTGAVAVTGLLGGSTTFGPGEPNATVLSDATAFLARYDEASGLLAWARGIAGHFVPAAIATTPQGEVLLAGTLADSATLAAGTTAATAVTTPYRDVLLARFDPNGIPVWTQRVDRGPSTGYAVAVFADGSAIVLGNMFAP